MNNIVCTQCGLEGFTKCPYCRSIFADESTRIGSLDSMVSHHLKIHEDRLEWRLFGDKSPGRGLRTLQSVLKDLTLAELTVLACVHSWDFKPCHHSTIGCGHGSEEKPLEEFMQDVGMYLAEKGDEQAYEIVAEATRKIGSVYYGKEQ